MLTFAAVSLSVEGIANRGEATAAIQLRGQGELMERRDAESADVDSDRVAGLLAPLFRFAQRDGLDPPRCVP